MLQAIRSKAGSLIVKILFAILIIGFGFWGIGDVLIRSTTDTTVVRVGGTAISAEQLKQAVGQEVQRMQRIFGASFNMEQAKQFGIVDQQLNVLIGTELVNQEVARLRLAIGDDTLLKLIIENAAFRGPSGQFDPALFRQYLLANRMSEAQYYAQLRAEVAREELLDAVTGGVSGPKPLADTLYRIRAERRIADTVFVPFASIADVGQPSETDLTEFHDKHADQFRAPELRSFTIAYLKLEDLADPSKVSDDEVRDEYQRRIDEFQTPERRHVEQILVPDQATADQALSALRGGKTFATVAKQVAKMDAGPSDLGTVAKPDLPPELAETAFTLAADGISDPIKTGFGWHILHVVAIEPATTKSFDAVKPAIAAEIARERAEREMSDMINKVKDTLASGKDLDAVAAELKLKLVKVKDIDQTGHTINGGTIVLPPPSGEILSTAFNTEPSQLSDVVDTADGGFFVVHLDNLTPSAVRPLAEVRDQVLAAWQQDQRVQRVMTEIKEVAAAVNAGAPLKLVAADRKLTLKTTPALNRSGGEDGGLPRELVTEIFKAKLHQALTGESGDGAYVAELTEIVPADPDKAKPDLDQLTADLSNALQRDILTEYTQALRGHFKVETVPSNLDRAF
ncbi:MAG TPA: peptidyl-prolyl cis-trans isomerase [Stellaceae bacterium]|nr:peptidyl-prolyl cis-trans isomerase [Stellaceae bacterium]